MKFNIDKMICNLGCCEELSSLKYFIQLNVYENFKMHYKMNIRRIEATTPNLQIYSIKIVDTIEGVDSEGQNLTGKKLIVIGNVSTNLVLNYATNHKRSSCLRQHISEVNIPFSTFIIIPKNICYDEEVNLRYLIEDTTTTLIEENNVFVSITMLIQYLDEY